MNNIINGNRLFVMSEGFWGFGGSATRACRAATLDRSDLPVHEKRAAAEMGRSSFLMNG